MIYSTVLYLISGVYVCSLLHTYIHTNAIQRDSMPQYI